MTECLRQPWRRHSTVFQEDKGTSISGRVQRELSIIIEAQERNLVDAIAPGEPLEPLLGELKEDEQREQKLLSILTDMTAAAPVIELDSVRIKHQLRWKGG